MKNGLDVVDVDPADLSDRFRNLTMVAPRT